MGITKQDREFRLPKVTFIDFKLLQMDRVLTAFFQRLKHRGYPSRLIRQENFELSVQSFVDEFFDHPDKFVDFEKYPDITKHWIETHLLDMVNRGKPNKAVAAPRPLHGLAYRFRNPKHSRDYNAGQQLYETISGARGNSGEDALNHLRDFFFQGFDLTTNRTNNDPLDVETQALLSFEGMVNVKDFPNEKEPPEKVPPPCIGGADLLAEDVQRLLLYRWAIPRSVMVDYLKILFSFHLALNLLRLFKLLPALVRQEGNDPVCRTCPMKPREFSEPHGNCAHQFGILVDVANLPKQPMARLAERSADTHYRRIPSFIKAHFVARKLDEFANELERRGKLTKNGPIFTLNQVLGLLNAKYKQERENHFDQRISRMLQEESGQSDATRDPEIEAILKMDLSHFDTYIEILTTLRGAFHRRYITECLDALLMKNDPGAMIAQPKGRGGQRRFILDSRLLEVLLQIAVLQVDSNGKYRTTEIRIDELLTFLRQRYGIYIDQLPPGDGFGVPSIDDRQTLRQNLQAFVERLREVGYYKDLSDAYITQTITPRYVVDEIGQVVSSTRTGAHA